MITAKFENSNKNTYLNFTSPEQEVIYVLKNDENVKTINLLKWENFFTQFAAGNEGNIICDQDQRKEIETHLKPDEEQTHTAVIKAQRRKIVCRHPLEFDQTFYTKDMLGERNPSMTEEDKTRIEAKAKLLDMWEGIKVLKDFEGTENNFWFAHPIGFISHLARMGALEKANIADRILMGTNGISGDGPCLAMAYFGIAQTYAGRNLTAEQINTMLADPNIYTEEYGARAPRIVIARALNILGVDTSNLSITFERDVPTADPNSFATIRHVGTRATPEIAGHFQQGTNTGAFLWDPIDGIEDIGRRVHSYRNIYIEEKE